MRQICALVIPLSLGLAQISKATVFDLTSDWSTSSNPNGVWSYRYGTTLLTAQTGWSGDTWSTPQQGWIGNFTPFFFKSNGTEQFTHDWTANTVVAHTSNPGNADFNVLWTSPFAGIASITGGTWEGRDIGRSNTWSILKNGITLTSGSISSGDPYSSSNPFNFLNGSGGAGILTNLPVLSGDTFELHYSQTANVGDYVGMTFTINSTPVPEPASLGFLAVGLAALLRRRSGLDR